MSGLNRYYVTGWSARFGMWVAETMECATMEIAKKRYQTSHPTLKQIKVYLLNKEH